MISRHSAIHGACSSCTGGALRWTAHKVCGAAAWMGCGRCCPRAHKSQSSLVRVRVHSEAGDRHHMAGHLPAAAVPGFFGCWQSRSAAMLASLFPPDLPSIPSQCRQLGALEGAMIHRDCLAWCYASFTSTFACTCVPTDTDCSATSRIDHWKIFPFTQEG